MFFAIPNPRILMLRLCRRCATGTGVTCSPCAAPGRPEVYSQHAPEVKCSGKSEAHRPHEFGVKVSLAAT